MLCSLDLLCLNHSWWIAPEYPFTDNLLRLPLLQCVSVQLHANVNVQVYDRTKLDPTPEPWPTVLHFSVLNPLILTEVHPVGLRAVLLDYHFPHWELTLLKIYTVAVLQRCFHLSNRGEERAQQSQGDLSGVIMLCHCAGNDAIVFQCGD